MENKTVVVNLFAGPGAGKTTCAWEIASELKKRGIEAEYVPEYAKELVWNEEYELLDGSFEHQLDIYKEQNRRVQRLIGKVDVVVTDSPAILSVVYLTEHEPQFECAAIELFKQQQNFNLFINRGKDFQQAGRKHNLEESIELDHKIKDFLKEHDIYFGRYYHHTLGVLVDNIIRNLENVNSVNLEDKLSNAVKKAEEINSAGKGNGVRNKSVQKEEVVPDK